MKALGDRPFKSFNNILHNQEERNKYLRYYQTRTVLIECRNIFLFQLSRIICIKIGNLHLYNDCDWIELVYMNFHYFKNTNFLLLG